MQSDRINDSFAALESVYYERRQAAKTAGATSPNQGLAGPKDPASQPAEPASGGAKGPLSEMLEGFSRDLHRFASHNDFKVCRRLAVAC